jgi:hypothetical protein
MGGEETGRSFAAPLVLPIEFCAIYSACEAATFSRERAISRLRRASEEARRIEALHHNQFDEVIRCREHGSTYSTPAKIKRWKTDQLNTGAGFNIRFGSTQIFLTVVLRGFPSETAHCTFTALN